MENIGVWFDIPVTDIERAKKFYSVVLDVQFHDMVKDGYKIAMFPYENGIVSGALVEYKGSTPSMTGTVIYLNGGKDLSIPLSRVKDAGREILQDKTSIGEHGYIAYFRDTEGNKVGLHSMS